MNNLIDELNQKISLLKQENGYLQIQINSLLNDFNATCNETSSLSVQKEKQKLMRNIYDTKRKILKNKMSIYRCCERIDYIKHKGEDFPDNYGEVKFTNDNYYEINVADISRQNKLIRENSFFSCLFNKNLFSMQNRIKKRFLDNTRSAVIYKNFTLAVKDIFDNLINEIHFFIVSLSNNQSSMTDEQLMYAISKYLKNYNIDFKKYNLPIEYEKDINTIKDGYIKLLTAELNVYMKKNMTCNEILDLSNIQFFGSKIRLVNHLNIFLNQFIQYQVEHFDIETDAIKFDVEISRDSDNPLNGLSYINDLDSTYENDFVETLVVDSVNRQR